MITRCRYQCPILYAHTRSFPKHILKEEIIHFTFLSLDLIVQAVVKVHFSYRNLLTPVYFFNTLKDLSTTIYLGSGSLDLVSFGDGFLIFLLGSLRDLLSGESFLLGSLGGSSLRGSGDLSFTPDLLFLSLSLSLSRSLSLETVRGEMLRLCLSLRSIETDRLLPDLGDWL